NATLTIIHHDGTPKKFTQVENIKVENSCTVKLQLKEGRRTSPASVPPPEALQSQAKQSPAKAGPGPLAKLRDLANPHFNGFKGVRGGIASMGVHVGDNSPPIPGGKAKSGEVVFQASLPSLTSGVGLTARAVVAPDGKSLQLELTPVFQAPGTVEAEPAV